MGGRGGGKVKEMREMGRTGLGEGMECWDGWRRQCKEEKEVGKGKERV